MMELKEKLFTDEIKRLTPVLSRQTAERLSRAYLIGDETTRKRIVEMLDIMKASVMADPQLNDSALLEPPTLSGDMEIGELLYGRKNVGQLLWNKEILMTHVGIFGSSGYGKTNLSYSLVRKLSDEGVPVVIFDFSKKNYRDLLQTPLKDRISVYTVGGKSAPLRFNPLKAPPGVSKIQWAKEFAEIFDHAYWLLGGGRHIIMKALTHLYETNDKPILADLKKHVESLASSTSRERNWVATSLRPLESLCIRETEDIFSVADGVSPSRFFEAGKITILEMDPLSTNDKTFFIEIMMQWIRDWLLANGTREKLEGAIILEEAHHILNREKSKKIGSETVMDLVFREMRELGLGIIYLDQHPSMISYPALGNTSTHIYMNLGLDTRYSSDIEDATNMLGLDKDYQEYLRRLPVGHAFVLMRMSEWTKPFSARFPHFALVKGAVKDSDISQLMKHSFHEDKMEIDDVQWKIIQSIGSGKGVFTSQIYNSLRLSGTLFKDKISSLSRNNIVGIREVRMEKTKANYYYLTETGEKLFSSKFREEVRLHGSEEKAEKILKSFGWKFVKKGNEFTAENDGKEIRILTLTDTDRKKIEKSAKDGMFYICGSPEIRNMLLQSAAKLDRKMRISIALMDSVEKGFTEFIL